VRREPKLVDELFARMLRMHPAATLQVAEATPALRDAFARVQKRMTDEPVAPEELGQACAEASHLVVARALANDQIEVSHFVDCRLVDRIVTTVNDDDRVAATLRFSPASAA
jgi:hypothetical protein